MENDNLKQVLDSMDEIAIYVIREDTHELLYFNRHVKEVSPETKLGMQCHKLWGKVCLNCPLITIGEQSSNHVIHYDSPFGRIVDVIANRDMWDGKIPAFVITIAPHKLNYVEEHGLEKIEKIYTKSLVTVFNECIIANLTEDFYVNCQKDMLWTDIPEKGSFDIGNKHYSKATIHPDDLELFNASFSRDAMLRMFESGKKQISRKLRRLMGADVYHMVEFTATCIEEFDENCWCVLVYRDINEEYWQDKMKNIEIGQLATAARVAYQMLIAVNLTQNLYHMMEYDRFSTKKAAESGCFDDLIKVGVSTVAPEFREEFVEKFSRKSLLERFERGDRQVTMEMRQMGDDGIYHWNSTQVVMIENPYTKDVMEITMTKNIDDERRQQEENLSRERKASELLAEALQKAESANQAKSDFMSRMSHDIRTPLNAILGMTTLAQVYINDKEKVTEYLKKIEVSGGHLLGLINEVLDVSKIESGRMELEEIDFSLRNLVRDAVSIVQPAFRNKAQELLVELPDSIHSFIRGDDQKLRQVLVNVLDNASKYTAHRGRIELKVEEFKVQGEFAGTYQFTIEDNGIGIEPDYVAHIFEPFSRAEDSGRRITGTGLGLTIVQNIVSMMGGSIRVESEYGRGTRFIIKLHFMKAAEQENGNEEKDCVDASGKDFSGMRALLVEDNEMNQQIAYEMLIHLGVTVEIAENGRMALDMVLAHPADYYSIVFMDIQMPVMNGYEAAEQIRISRGGVGRELPIVAMTADAFSEDIRKSRLAGMNGHIAKPISLEKLQAALSRCVGGRAG